LMIIICIKASIIKSLCREMTVWL